MENLQNPTSECSICRDSLVNAVKLDCGHIFCYMCIKSVAETTGTCALCRQEISEDFNFRHHQILGPNRLPASTADKSYWFYEGYKGWWLYDANVSAELEEAYQQGLSSLEVLIAGHRYLLDLSKMEQKRKDTDGRSRKILRNTTDLENVLGIAGIRDPDFNETWDMMKAAGQMKWRGDSD